MLALLVAAMAAVSCEQCVVRGTVADVKGEALPGVSVSANNSEAQALTDALGEYKLSCKPGRVELSFMKTGYTSGLLDIEAAGSGGVKATGVTLWCLPQSAGVYLFEDFRYRKLVQIEPKPFVMEKGNAAADTLQTPAANAALSIMYGIARLPEMEEALARKPLLIAFKMPRYDIQLCRLHPVKAKPLEPNPAIQEAWGPEAPVPTGADPIDEPDRCLTELQIAEALEPGVYAIHWGALEGATATDPRAFVFRIFDPEKPTEGGEPSAAPQESGENKAEKAKKGADSAQKKPDTKTDKPAASDAAQEGGW